MVSVGECACRGMRAMAGRRSVGLGVWALAIGLLLSLCVGVGDPTRPALAVALADSASACVCDLAWIVGRGGKLVSDHARALRAAGLATASRQGKMVITS